MSISTEIEKIVQRLTDNNIPTQKIIITKTYNDEHLCDIQTPTSTLRRITTNIPPLEGEEGLLVYPNSDPNTPLVLVFRDTYSKKEMDEIIQDIISGDIDLKDYVKWEQVDTTLSPSSNHPVENRAIHSALTGKADTNHTHDTVEVIEASPLPHLELGANANQHLINLAIDSRIGGGGGGGGTAIACVSDFSIDQTDIDDIKLYLDACQGKVITSITKTSSGLIDTYTIHYDNGDTYEFTIKNGSDATVTIDSALSNTSTNPVQNKVINTALNGKANNNHTHNISAITDLQTALNNKANATHNHEISDVTGLQSQLENKSDIGHNHDNRYYTETEVDAALEGKANTNHNHDDHYYTETETNNLLDSKQDELVSGTNIKTINNQSLLGSGNINIQGGDGSIIGTGSFSINSQGHLIVELPNGVDNPYFIDTNGHLIYDTSNTHNGGLIV